MRELVWSGPARRDLFAIAEHYAEVDPDLSDEMLGAIREAPLILLTHPEIGAPTEWQGLRKWPVRGTPFLLFYSAKAVRIEIVRVRHAAEDWRRS